ncbi:hypothetical protein Bcop_0405 [Bacteroides coprosuis DSM 18011]|uniref:Lipoprotein n=1 Tax=Bacteroides coprosuis DSM 18011 TaxID=679937 RepID=F3ZQW5_9BACE|nr:fimbrillin family protein [Bacteroides coprosuis]EGJ70623.1 hypothetical protein Bcop_0405 [Bacteroides coprosuis DSM 18011]
MKKLKALFLSLIAITLLGACSNDSSDSYDGFDYSGRTTVKFTANIADMGASNNEDNNWSLKDAIGMYAIHSGNTLSDDALYNERANVKYTTLSTSEIAEFKAAKANEAIQVECCDVDVIAYYPYNLAIKDYLYPIDVVKNEDVLYSNNVRNLITGDKAHLVFNHTLSQLILNVIAGENVTSLSNIVADKLSGTITEGNLDLATGLVSIKEGAKAKDIKTSVKAEKGQAIIKSLILPGQPIKNGTIKILLEGKEYVWSTSDETIVEPGKIYTYTMTINADGSWTVEPNGEVSDWTEGNADGDIDVLNPDKDDTEEPGKDIDEPVKPEDPNTGVSVGNEVIVMDEHFGINGKSRWDVKGDYFMTNNEFDTKNVSFSNEGTRLSARAINNITDKDGNFDKHVWFPRFDAKLDGKKPSTPTFKISNINTVGLNEITISYDIMGDMRTQKKEFINTTFIKVYADGEKLKVPSTDLGHKEFSDKYFTITLKIDKPFSELVFKSDSENYTGIRLDNLVIKGRKAE